MSQSTGMKMKLWQQITLAIMALVIAISGTHLWQSTTLMEKTLEDQQQGWSTTLSKALAKAVLRDTINSNRPRVRETLERVKNESTDIAYLILIDFNSQILATTRGPVPERLLHQDHSTCHFNRVREYHIGKGQHIHDISHPLIDKLDAHIHVGINSAVLHDRVDDVENRIIISTLIISSLAIVISLLFGMRIGRPIETLAAQARSFGKGETSGMKIFFRSSTQEVSTLHDSFLEMMQQRQKHETELDNYKDHLQALVKQRTAELEKEIEKHKATEQQLVSAKNNAEEANNAKSAFLSRMSHELRTPLNAILGFAQLLDFDTQQDDELNDNVNEIIVAGNHLLTLVNEVLDLAKVEAGEMTFSLEDLDAISLMEECIRLVTPAANKNHISLGFQPPADSLFLKADRMRLKQIFLNLLSNAVKYNKQNGHVHISLSRDAQDCKVQIQDTGIGISERHQKRLFEPFNRLDAENTGIEGTGIGLHLSKQLVEAMQGQIHFESKLGLGSTFYVSIPLSDTAKQSASDHLSEQVPDADKQQVVYIEDNPANATLINKVFDTIDTAQVRIFDDPREGIRHCEAFPPRLILLDIHLPAMSGFEVKRHLAKHPQTAGIPVIAISANPLASQKNRAEELGFADYITKPIEISALVDTLKPYLQKQD